MKVKSFSCVWLFGTPWTVAYQAPPSMGSSRQEYWSELPFPSSRESSQPRGLWHCKQTLCGSAGKESACNVGDPDSIPGLGRFPGEGKGYPFQYSGLEDSHGLYGPWGHKESDTTEQLSLSLHFTLERLWRWEISFYYY